MKAGAIVLLIGASVFSVLWTVWYFFEHLSGRARHLEGKAYPAYQWQLKGYKAERKGQLQEAVDAYSRSLKLDPTNHELEARRARLLEAIAGQDKNG